MRYERTAETNEDAEQVRSALESLRDAPVRRPDRAAVTSTRGWRSSVVAFVVVLLLGSIGLLATVRGSSGPAEAPGRGGVSSVPETSTSLAETATSLALRTSTTRSSTPVSTLPAASPAGQIRCTFRLNPSNGAEAVVIELPTADGDSLATIGTFYIEMVLESDDGRPVSLSTTVGVYLAGEIGTVLYEETQDIAADTPTGVDWYAFTVGQSSGVITLDGICSLI